MNTWQLQEAKAHLSEWVKKAFSGAPQEITLRGKPAVVVLSTQQNEKLKQPKKWIIESVVTLSYCACMRSQDM